MPRVLWDLKLLPRNTSLTILWRAIIDSSQRSQSKNQLMEVFVWKSLIIILWTSASKHQLWQDVAVRLSPEVGCLSCGISTINATARNKVPHTGASRPGEHIFLDILHPLVTAGLTTTSVINILWQYQADHLQASSNFGYLNIERIRADAGSQFTADQFKEHCRNSGIHLVLAAPKKKYQNHLAERTWQAVTTMGRSLLVHTWLPDTFMFSALVYATHIFSILPVQGLLNEEAVPSTHYQLFLVTSQPSPTFESLAVPLLYVVGLLPVRLMGNRQSGASMESSLALLYTKRATWSSPQLPVSFWFQMMSSLMKASPRQLPPPGSRIRIVLLFSPLLATFLMLQCAWITPVQ